MTRTDWIERREYLLKELDVVWESLNETRIKYTPGAVADTMARQMTRVNELRLAVRGWGVYETEHFD